MKHVEILYNEVVLPKVYSNLIINGELGNLSELELDSLAQLQDVLTASYRKDYPTLTEWRLQHNTNAICLYGCVAFDVIITY